MDSEVCLETKRVDDGNQTLDAVQRRAGHGGVLQHVAAAAREDGVQIRHSIRGAEHGAGVDRLHEPRPSHEEGGVASAAGSGDDLPSTPENGLSRKINIREAELGVADRFFAQRPFASRPREALLNGVADAAQDFRVDFRGDGVVLQDVGPHVFWPESPDVAAGQHVVAVVLLEKLADFAHGVFDADAAALDVFGDAVVEGLGDESELVLFVRGEGVAFDAALVLDCFAEAGDGVRDFDLHVGVEFAEVVQDAVHVEFAGAEDDVLAGFFDFGCDEGVGFVDFAEAVEHLRQF